MILVQTVQLVKVITVMYLLNKCLLNICFVLLTVPEIEYMVVKRNSFLHRVYSLVRKSDIKGLNKWINQIIKGDKIAMRKNKQKRATLHREAGKTSLRKWHLSSNLKDEKEGAKQKNWGGGQSTSQEERVEHGCCI